MTIGSVEPLKKLHARWGDAVHFVDIVIRQAHPGPDEPPYRTFSEKFRDARRYQRDEGIPWVVLADDLAGTVHQVYGGLADPAYLIDRDGRVAFYDMWTDVPSLYEAIAELLAQDGRGVVRSGMKRRPAITPALTDGWRGIRRGLPQSALDLMVAMPGTPLALWLGCQLKPLLAPLTLREKPLPPAARAAVAGSWLAVAGLLWGIRRARRR